jgi:hypothetical protein
MLATIHFTDVVLAIHVAAVVVAFGGVFAYPAVVPWIRHAHPEALPAVHELQYRISQRVIGPGLVVILAAGIYLASKLDVWSQSWVSIPLVILIILGGMGGMFFNPGEKRLAELAKTVPTTPEYDALAARVFTGQLVAMGLVLVAIFFMVVKP